MLVCRYLKYLRVHVSNDGFGPSLWDAWRNIGRSWSKHVSVWNHQWLLQAFWWWYREGWHVPVQCDGNTTGSWGSCWSAVWAEHTRRSDQWGPKVRSVSQHSRLLSPRASVNTCFLLCTVSSGGRIRLACLQVLIIDQTQSVRLKYYTLMPLYLQTGWTMWNPFPQI